MLGHGGRQDPKLLGPGVVGGRACCEQGPTLAWVLTQDPRALGPEEDPMFFGLGFLNIIICVINIIMFIN